MIDHSNDVFKTLMLVKRWDHHTASGGYSRLEEEIGQGKIIKPGRSPRLLSERNSRRVFFRVLPSARFINRYTFSDMLAELKVLYEIRRRNYSVIHSLYAEDQLNLLLTYKKYVRPSLIGTFHLPPETRYMRRILPQNKEDRFRNLDGAIAVSRSLANFYAERIGRDKVTYIPHGVDTSVFTPDQTVKEQLDQQPMKVLIVGSHGRDWDTLEHVIKGVRENNLPVKFTAVINQKGRVQFEPYPEVQLLSNIPEKELIGLYRKAHLLLMPVTFATANNSLLESLACGTPVISTNTGGIPDYLNEECGWMLPPGDAAAVYHLLEELAFNRTSIKEKEIHSRTWALNFGWEKIMKQTLDFYKEIAGRSNENQNG